MQSKFVRGAILGGLVSAALVIGGVYTMKTQSGSNSTSSFTDSTLSNDKAPALPSASNAQAKPTLALANLSHSAANKLPQNLPKDMPKIEKRSKVSLWEKDTRISKTEINGIPALHLRVDPQVLQEFHVGQQVNLDIPQSDASIQSQITSTHNQVGGVKVWKGAISNGDPMDNVIVTQGDIETHVIVSTKNGTYTAVIDNKTGQTTIVDEGEIVARSLPIEDGIPADPINDSPPLG